MRCSWWPAAAGNRLVYLPDDFDVCVEVEGRREALLRSVVHAVTAAHLPALVEEWLDQGLCPDAEVRLAVAAALCARWLDLLGLSAERRAAVATVAALSGYRNLEDLVRAACP